MQNPVVRGLAPDPSLIRVGEDYYLALSTFQWFPALPVLRSRDLVHWETVGSVEHVVPTGDLRGMPDSGGVWAPALSHDGELFHLVYAVVGSVARPQFDLDVYRVSAERASGPWSAPQRLPSHGFDPSLFHADGRTWLLNVQNDQRPGRDRFSGIVLQEIDRATGAGIGVPRLLDRRTTLVEGPKLLRRGDQHLLLLAEGGTGWEHGVRVLRARHPEGPYEECPEPLLTTRDRQDLAPAKAGHGELVESPDGRWYLAHLAARPVAGTASARVSPLGRETFLQEVEWDAAGWPRLRGGGHHPAETYPALGEEPADGRTRVRRPPLTLREPQDPSWCRVTAGAAGDEVALRGRQGLASPWTVSLLARPLEEHRTRTRIRIDAEPDSFTRSAGVALYHGTDAWVTARRAWEEPEGERQEGQQWEGRGRGVLELVLADRAGVRRLAALPADGAGPWEVEVGTEGSLARFRVRRPEQDWEDLGGAVALDELTDDAPGALRFTGLTLAVHAEDTAEAAWWATFTVPPGWGISR